MSSLYTKVDGSIPSMFSPRARDFIRIASVDLAVKWVPGGDNLVKGVQSYELFGGIALKNHAFSFSFFHFSFFSTKLFILSLFGWTIFKMMYATESRALMIDIHIIMLFFSLFFTNSPPRWIIGQFTRFGKHIFILSLFSTQTTFCLLEHQTMINYQVSMPASSSENPIQNATT